MNPWQSVESPARAESGEAPGRQAAGGENHGKESRKFNSGCTICRSCRLMTPDSVVQLQRENRVVWRESQPVGAMGYLRITSSPRVPSAIPLLLLD